ncbi:MAG: DUF5320 domain-containing protein [Armatimonadota bacterium]
MPRGDGTGPAGARSMCTQKRGVRNRFYSSGIPCFPTGGAGHDLYESIEGANAEALKKQAEYFEQALEKINSKLEEIKSSEK